MPGTHVKEESLACQATSPLNNKLGWFINNIKKIALQKTISLWNGEVIWQASVTKELQGWSIFAD